jgi:hypothetical protein
MSPYFLLSFVSLQSEEAARGLLCSQRSEERLILFISGRLFATGEISGDGMWSHHDSDEEEDECQGSFGCCRTQSKQFQLFPATEVIGLLVKVQRMCMSLRIQSR